MDKKFHPAIAAIKAGDVEKLKALVAEDPSLATSRSTRSHPTLLQCLVLDAKDLVEYLLNHGADPNVKDDKVGSTAAGWADYGGQPEIRDLLTDLTTKTQRH